MWYKLLFSWVWEFLKPIAAILLKDGGQHLADVALMIVKELQNTDMSNVQKREAAFDKLWEEVKVQGWEFGESACRLVLETAVQRLKGK